MVKQIAAITLKKSMIAPPPCRKKLVMPMEVTKL